MAMLLGRLYWWPAGTHRAGSLTPVKRGPAVSLRSQGTFSHCVAFAPGANGHQSKPGSAQYPPLSPTGSAFGFAPRKVAPPETRRAKGALPDARAREPVPRSRDIRRSFSKRSGASRSHYEPVPDCSASIMRVDGPFGQGRGLRTRRPLYISSPGDRDGFSPGVTAPRQ
ncbi:hypothetical protein AAFF_G00305710 [Aldrovandia affinis]|uniref:Uncharacterized protein n=1 Tax=Aldrovandia affinis TaxID=143900 RepID=A0AAD7SPG0_9TELE|nr:hypothetical protein AAFF_G00305710 [Aldrovandia affinis]